VVWALATGLRGRHRRFDHALIPAIAVLAAAVDPPSPEDRTLDISRLVDAVATGVVT